MDRRTRLAVSYPVVVVGVFSGFVVLCNYGSREGVLIDELAERDVEYVAVERDREALDAIVAAADAFDVVVMGESDPSLATFVFGLPADRVADQFLGPVLVVQREPPEGTED